MQLFEVISPLEGSQSYQGKLVPYLGSMMELWLGIRSLYEHTFENWDFLACKTMLNCSFKGAVSADL